MPIGDGKTDAGHAVEMTARRVKLGQATFTELAQKVQAAAVIGLPWGELIYVMKIMGFGSKGTRRRLRLNGKTHPSDDHYTGFHYACDIVPQPHLKSRVFTRIVSMCRSGM